jgi:hypothetical protein
MMIGQSRRESLTDFKAAEAECPRGEKGAKINYESGIQEWSPGSPDPS